MKHLVLVFKGGKFKVNFLKFQFFITIFSSNQCRSERNATCQPTDSIAISFISLLQDESNFWKGKIQDCITSRRLDGEKSENIKSWLKVDVNIKPQCCKRDSDDQLQNFKNLYKVLDS